MSGKWFLVSVLALCIFRHCDAEGTPTITRLINTGFVIGGPAVLECAVEDADGYNVYWVRINPDGDRDVISFDDTVLTDDARYSVSYDNDTTAYFLKIDTVTEEDRGTYRCEVVVPGGKTVDTGDIEMKPDGENTIEPETGDETGYKKIILELNEPTTQPRINQITYDQTLTAGENMIISCSVENADVRQLSWSKDDESGIQTPITVGTDIQVDNPRLSIRHDPVSNAYTMLITNIQVSDAGKYLCSVTSATTNEILTSRLTTVDVNPSYAVPDYSNPAQAAEEPSQTPTETTPNLIPSDPVSPSISSTTPQYPNQDSESRNYYPTDDRDQPSYVQPDSYPPQPEQQQPDYTQSNSYPEERTQNAPSSGHQDTQGSSVVPDYVQSNYPNVEGQQPRSQEPNYGYSGSYPRESGYQGPYYAQPRGYQNGYQAPDYSQSNSYPNSVGTGSRNNDNPYATDYAGSSNTGMNPTIEYISPTQNIEPGRAVILECNVRDAEDYVVLWTKDGRALTTEDTLLINDPRYAVRHDMVRQSYTLDINDVRDADGGIYKCEIQIPYASSVTKEVQLNIGNQNYQDMPARPEPTTAKPSEPKKPCCGTENIDFTEEFADKLSENIMNRVIPKLRNLQEEHREMQKLVTQLESDYRNIKQQLRVLRKREGRSSTQ